MFVHFNFGSNKNQLYDLQVFLCNGSSWFLRKNNEGQITKTKQAFNALALRPNEDEERTRLYKGKFSYSSVAIQ